MFQVGGETALILVDLQRAIDDPSWGRRNHPDAEHKTAAVLRGWRASGLPVIHVKHDSRFPASTYRPGQPGNDFKPEAVPLAGEPVFAKNTCNAFVSTGLEEHLKSKRLTRLLITGVITNNSVEATVRMAGDLQFDTWLMEDTCFTFDRVDWDGRPRTADEVHAMSLANLAGEYCSITNSTEVLEALRARNGHS